MLSTQYVSRVTLRRDKVESFARYPFSVPALREFVTSTCTRRSSATHGSIRS